MDAATWIIRQRRFVAAAWLIVAPAMLFAAGKLRDRMVPFTRLPGSESAIVEDILVDKFKSPFAGTLVLVARGLPPYERPMDSESLQRITLALSRVRGVTAVLSPANSADTLFRGNEPGSAMFVVGFDPGVTHSDSLIVALRRTSDTLAVELRAGAPDLTLHWTGLSAILLDMRHASAAATRRSELLALPAILVLLFLAFRSIVAALVPLVFGVVGIGVSLGAALVASLSGSPSLLLGNVVSILGLALGVDYSLLTVTRFREALARGEDSVSAAVYALKNAGHTIVVSGATVALGFAGLLLVPIGEIRSVGLGGLVTSLVTVALATTLLPALLCVLGRRIDIGVVGRAPPTEPGERWLRWARWVTAHPVRVVLLSGIPLVVLSISALRLNPGAPREGWLPRGESTRGLDDLRELGRMNFTNELSVLVDLTGLAATERANWTAVTKLADTLARHPRISVVRSIPTLAANRAVPSPLLWQAAPPWIREHFATADIAWVRMDVIPAPHLSPAEVSELVREIRAIDAPAMTGRPVALMVGGVPAFQADYEDAVVRSAPWVVASVILSVLLALAIGFRSVVIPIKATILNLLSVGAALGALVLVFQDGRGSSVFGLEHSLSGVFPAVPILAFCIVFGLSMDYEVFLVGRIAEIRNEFPALSERDAIVQGVARTGRVITFAAALMIVIFAAFAFGDYLPSKLFGFTLAVAVFADATLVRLAIGPALLQMAGRWNWWPGDRRRDQARVAPEGSAG